MKTRLAHQSVFVQSPLDQKLGLLCNLLIGSHQPPLVHLIFAELSSQQAKNRIKAAVAARQCGIGISNSAAIEVLPRLP